MHSNHTSMCVHKATHSTDQSWLFPGQTSVATLCPHYYVITIKARHCVTKKHSSLSHSAPECARAMA